MKLISCVCSVYKILLPWRSSLGWSCDLMLSCKTDYDRAMVFDTVCVCVCVCARACVCVTGWGWNNISNPAGRRTAEGNEVVCGGCCSSTDHHPCCPQSYCTGWCSVSDSCLVVFHYNEWLICKVDWALKISYVYVCT